MARSTPTVRDKLLCWPDDSERQPIVVGTAAWFAWLNTATTFSFVSDCGSFTARREHFQRGGWYWKAYRTRSGVAYRAYLGKLEALSLERLRQVAASLSERSAGPAVSLPPPGFPIAGPERPCPPPPGPLRAPGGGPSAGHLRFDRFLSTKLSPPLIRSDLVIRPRLLERLSDVWQRQLTLVSAPAGFGKTTLLSQWRRQASRPVAWLSLDDGDNDPARFWAYVVAALRDSRAPLGQRAQSLLRSAQLPSVDTFLVNLINTLATAREDVALVLDDYHVVRNETIHQAIGFLVDHLPSPLHLVLASRADPPFSLSRLRAQRQLLEVRSPDLSFTKEESALFLQQVMRLRLSDEDLSTLEERTEGWIAGLQLAALSLGDEQSARASLESFAGTDHHVVDYLAEEVLRRQPRDVQDFLLQTSILDRLSGPLCEALTGRPGAQPMLDKLDHANLFTVPLDGEHHWYRYHHLFVDFLRACLNQTRPALVTDLHRRACAWFAEQGFVGEAIDHALRASEFDLAAGWIEQAAEPMRQHGEMKTLLRWLDALPDDVVRGQPRLCLDHAWALAYAMQVDAAEDRLRDAEARLQADLEVERRTAPHAGADGGATQRLLGDALITRATIAGVRGDIPLSISLFQRALDLSMKDDTLPRSQIARGLGSAYRFGGDFDRASEVLTYAERLSRESGFAYLAVESLSELGGVQAVQGQLRLAAGTYRRTLDLATDDDGHALPSAGAPHVGLAALLYEWNDLGGAARHVGRGIQLGQQGGVTSVVLFGQGILARLRQARGDVDGALAVLHRAEQIALLNNFGFIVARLAALRARLLLKLGDVDAAGRWAEQIASRFDHDPDYLHESEFRALAQVRIAQGHAAEAVSLLERLLGPAQNAGRTGSVIKILILYAVALWRAGRDADALANLEEALSLGRQDGYVRSFVDGGPAVETLLARLLNHWQVRHMARVHLALPAYTRGLLKTFRSDAVPDDPNEDAAAVPSALMLLSDREREVLRLIAAGYTAQGVADEFVVAASTVKTHLKRLYAKLEVHNRAEAITRARALKLL